MSDKFSVWMLEDMPERAALLTELTGVTPSRSPSVAAAHAEGAFRHADVWMLDHDLCVAGPDEPCPDVKNEFRIGCRCPTGRDFIRDVVHLGVPWPNAVIVHSANPAGREAMISRLRQAGCPRYYLLPVETWRTMVPTLWSLVRETQDEA